MSLEDLINQIEDVSVKEWMLRRVEYFRNQMKNTNPPNYLFYSQKIQGLELMTKSELIQLARETMKFETTN